MTKVLFISYSHDSEEHCAWVKQFADDLAALGDFDVLLDQNLPKGYPFSRFMEYGLERADKVLIIGTPQYKEKSVSGKGVAFEEAIIGAELMRDIDTTKYYPILRLGSFEESFPPILQGRKGDDISDDSRYEEVIKAIADSLTNERPVPKVLTGMPQEQKAKSQKVANVYFSVNLMFATYIGKPVKDAEGIVFGVRVTNLEKEIRYFDQPYFKLSVPFEEKADSFIMLNVVQAVDFPAKLEFGQQFFVSYKLVPGNIEMFRKIIAKEPEATIKAIVVTSLGEVSESEPHKLSKIVDDTVYLS